MVMAMAMAMAVAMAMDPSNPLHLCSRMSLGRKPLPQNL